jgi:pSer/pThr/pTyr-binding forkhead associated (FHA) protein
MSARAVAHHETLIAEIESADQLEIVLKPLSHPALADIRIAESLFAIGRTEQPFASYQGDIVAELSRRHARIFRENGTVYVADLGSTNGTTVNRIHVGQKPQALRDGDEICFAGVLSYQVKLCARVKTARAATPPLLSLTLRPERVDLALQPIVIARFPFLISKTEETFSRYKHENPQQFSYLSRRHAHIFLKGGLPFIEDLGSTNGTFVSGKRLDEHAVPLEDGDLLAFGGNHFAYRVEHVKAPAADPTMTKLAAVAPATAEKRVHRDKTTFVAAADSFLEIFCVDDAPQRDDEADPAAISDDAGRENEKNRPRSKFAILLSELREALGGAEPNAKRRTFSWGASLAAALGIVVLVLYLSRASERELKELVASGEYARAATLASQFLERDPDNAEFKALETEAVLKANVPTWLARLKARDFTGANAVLAGMTALGSRNADLRSLVGELQWIGDLENFVVARGGIDAPIRIYADEENIKALLKRWDEDTQGHQRAFARISSYVQEFKDPYAEALTHLRKLQSDDLAYLAAIDRLKATIDSKLSRDEFETLEAVLKEYSEKYPRLAGLDGVRQDLRQYIEVEREARARRLSRLVALIGKVQFSTPPFQDKYRALASSDQLPPAEVVRQYQAVSKAWREGDAREALSNLQRMAAGPWADAASRELENKKTILDQFAALQKARGSGGYPDRLLAFYGSLDADEDVFFVRATEADVGLHKDQAIARAEQLLSRAQAVWRQYRETGPIDGRQRLAAEISNLFRTQAQSLAEAHELAQQGIRIYAQLKLARPAQWDKVQEEIKAEAELQRKALLELRNVLEPGLLKAKLALLGGRSNEERKSS